MAQLILDKNIIILEWLFSEIPISQIFNIAGVNSIYTTNSNNTGFISYNRLSLFNALASLKPNQTYLISSDASIFNPLIIDIPDSLTVVSAGTSFSLSGKIGILTYRAPSCNISSFPINYTNIFNNIYAVNAGGNGYISYSSSSMFNSLNSLINNTGIIVETKDSNSTPFVVFDINSGIPQCGSITTTVAPTTTTVTPTTTTVAPTTTTTVAPTTTTVAPTTTTTVAPTTTTVAPTTTTTVAPTTTTVAPTTTTTVTPTTTTVAPTTTTTVAPTTTTVAPTTTTTVAPTTTTTSGPTTTTTSTTTIPPTALNWNSVDGVWQNQTNWLEQTAPTNDISTNNAIFSQNIGDQISKLSSDTSITGINFSHPNSTLIISNNSSPKSLTVGGLGLRTTTGASSSTTMGSSINPLLLNVARAQTWSNLSNNPFRIFGFVTNSSSNNITLSIGSIDVFGSIYENNSGGTLNLRYFTNNISSTNYRSIPSNNTYNGNTTITNGRYFLDNNNIFGSGSGILEIRLATLLANNDIVIPNPALLPTSHLINNFITFSGDYSYTFENSFTINNSNIRVKNLIPNNKSLSILGSFIRGPIGTIISISSPIFDGSGNMNISGNMINNHANIETLNWNSSGVLTLSGSNTNSRWNIRGNSGIVVIQNSNSYWTAGANIVNNGCTMVLGFPISQNFINAIGSASTGDIALTSSSSVSLTWNSSASLGAYGPDPITYSGSIIPQNGFYRLGGGGGTLIVDGISFTGNNGLVLGGASSGLGGTVILNNTTISNTGEIVISKNTEVETSSCFADSSSAIAMNRDSKLIYNGSGCTTDRTINLTGQSPLIIYSPETTVEANGTCFPMTISSIINSGVGDTTLILSGASTIDNILSGAITGPSTSVVKTGSGLWRLSGLSSYGGQLRVLDGTLVVATSVDASAQNANGPFGSSGLPIIGSSEAGITGTASLLVAVGQSINRGFSVAPLGSGSSQVVVIGSTDIGTTGFGTTVFGGGHRIGLGRDVTLQASRNGIALFSSIWTEEPYNGQIDNRSPAVAITIGSNGNDGIVLLESMLPESITKLDIMYGTLQYQSIIYGDLPDRIGILTPVTINSSVFDINGQSQTLANLSFAGSSARVLNGTLVLNNVVNVVGVGHEIGSAVTLSNNVTLSGSGELLISGIVSGTHNIIKNGSGLLKLSGANTYSGTTIINGGIIKAESSTAFGSGTITVNSGGTLDRNGYSISNNIVNNGGTVL